MHLQVAKQLTIWLTAIVIMGGRENLLKYKIYRNTHGTCTSVMVAFIVEKPSFLPQTSWRDSNIPH